MRIAPMTVSAARVFVRMWHRHLPEVQGGLFAAGLLLDGVLVGVAIGGHPPRVWMHSGRFVIGRVATTGARNACSKLYGAMCRAGEALGYSEAWTYTLPEEPGDSLRAAGFDDMGLTDGGEWDRPSRARKKQPRPDVKRRWRRRLNPR